MRVVETYTSTMKTTKWREKRKMQLECYLKKECGKCERLGFGVVTELRGYEREMKRRRGEGVCDFVLFLIINKIRVLRLSRLVLPYSHGRR